MEEFDQLGEDDVRERLAQRIWPEEKERSARDWLDKRASTRARVANTIALDANNAAWRSQNAARVSNWIAVAALVVAVIALVISILK